MLFACILLAFGLGIAYTAPQGPPGLASLPYTVVQDLGDGVEEREYSAVTLPSYSSVPCLTWNAAQSQGYFHLSMYTRGGVNAEKRRLNMGVPVLLNVKHIDDIEERCSQLYTTSFYVDDPKLPEPNNTGVKLTKHQEGRYYVTSSSSIVRNPSDIILGLRVKLNARGLCYDPENYIIASYNSPSSLLNQRTEAWLPVVKCPIIHPE